MPHVWYTHFACEDFRHCARAERNAKNEGAKEEWLVNFMKMVHCVVWVPRDATESWEEANSQLHLPGGQENLKVWCQSLYHLIPDGELLSQGGGLARWRRRLLRRLPPHHGFASETENRSTSESINRSNNLTNILPVIWSKKKKKKKKTRASKKNKTKKKKTSTLKKFVRKCFSVQWISLP